MAKKRYVIWDEVSDIYTPSGHKFTAEQWFERYPIARLETEYLVISGAAYNGGFCMVYSDMVDIYEREGCDFTGCEEMQDYLDAIEAFEDEMIDKGLDIGFIKYFDLCKSKFFVERF